MEVSTCFSDKLIKKNQTIPLLLHTVFFSLFLIEVPKIWEREKPGSSTLVSVQNYSFINDMHAYFWTHNIRHWTHVASKYIFLHIYTVTQWEKKPNEVIVVKHMNKIQQQVKKIFISGSLPQYRFSPQQMLNLYHHNCYHVLWRTQGWTQKDLSNCLHIFHQLTL